MIQLIRLFGLLALSFFVFLNIYLDPTTDGQSQLSLSLLSFLSFSIPVGHSRPMEGKQNKTCLWRELEWAHPEHYMETVLYGDSVSRERKMSRVRIMLEKELVGVGWSSSSASLLF